VTPEARQRGFHAIAESIGLRDADLDLGRFPDQLRDATRSLSRFRAIEQMLPAGAKPFELVRALDAGLRKSADPPTRAEGPPDGVLICSMRTGALECAGRSLIASTLLKDRGIPHAIVQAPGHSFLLIETADDTLAYMDPNNNLLFTFPTSALEGWRGTNDISACRLRPFVPRESDTIDGAGVPFTDFIVVPPDEGVARQYLDNVNASLWGKPEFSASGIPIDRAASDAVGKMQEERFGVNETLATFFEQMEQRLARDAAQDAVDTQTIMKLAELFPERDAFARAFASVLEGELGDRVPFLKHAPREVREQHAAVAWDRLQGRRGGEIIRRV